MKRLTQLFNGKLTAYQIATATDTDIKLIESLLSEETTLDSIDETTFERLSTLENELFSSTNSENKKETSA